MNTCFRNMISKYVTYTWNFKDALNQVCSDLFIFSTWVVRAFWSYLPTFQQKMLKLNTCVTTWSQQLLTSCYFCLFVSGYMCGCVCGVWTIINIMTLHSEILQYAYFKIRIFFCVIITQLSHVRKLSFPHTI